MIDQDSVNNLNHVKKILSLEFDKVMKLKDKDKAYQDYWKNLINLIDLARQNIEIANDTSRYIERDKKMHIGEKYDKKT